MKKKIKHDNLKLERKREAGQKKRIQHICNWNTQKGNLETIKGQISI